MTSRQKLRLALTDLDRPRRTPTIEHVYERHIMPRRIYKPRYQAGKRRQPNVAAELLLVGLVLAAMLLILNNSLI